MEVVINNITNNECNNCINEINNLLVKDVYISKKEYQKYLDKYKNVFDNINLLNDNNQYKKELINISNNIDNIISKHNNDFLDKKLIEYKDYFDNMFKDIDPNIILDDEQKKAILTEEDYSLIIAGAGTGKTTTMASKVKYLVDIKKVDPTKIIVMSYTRKATEELAKRIQIDFNIPANIITFHSLGLLYIREIFKNRKCYVVDENTKENIFYNYFKENIFPYKDKIEEIYNNFNPLKEYLSSNFLFSNFFMNNYKNFSNFEDFFIEYKKNKLSEIKDLKSEVEERIEKKINLSTPLTIKNEIMKSKGEAIIANFLYMNGIDYYYEKVYKEMFDNNVTYRPDFTLELGGEEVYIEYFGLSTYKDNELNRYNKIRKMKINYHEKHKTKFIKIDYQPGEDIVKTLKQELIKLGFQLKPRSYEEIFERLLDNNPLAPLFPYKNFLYRIIENIKSSPKRKNFNEIIINEINKLPDNQKKEAEIQYKYILDFYIYYQKKLYGVEEYGFDFSDMIYYANLYINKIGINNKLNFEYLIIDEYQDISQIRYEFTKNIVYKNNGKIVAVGDDWQSIFSFTGSKIKYIYDFEKYFPGAKLLKINYTYRNSQELIDYSGEFIMRNPQQIKKELISNKNLKSPIKFVLFDDEQEYEILKKLIKNIHINNPEHNIMILGRTNKIIDKCFDDELKKKIDTKIEYIGYEDIQIDGMTIHKSKGLTSDEVIIIGLDNKFPLGEKQTSWIEKPFKFSTDEEKIPFAEERRLFYVALTRTKNIVYLLVNKNRNLRSPYIYEIYNLMKEKGIDENELFVDLNNEL